MSLCYKVNQTSIKGAHITIIAAATVMSAAGLSTPEYLKDKDDTGLCVFNDSGISHCSLKSCLSFFKKRLILFATISNGRKVTHKTL